MAWSDVEWGRIVALARQERDLRAMARNADAFNRPSVVARANNAASALRRYATMAGAGR